MNDSVWSRKLVRFCSLTVAFIFILLPFHALLTTWLGSRTGHLDLLRIWKEILICLLAGPSIWLAARRPALKKWFLSSWLVRLIALYSLLSIALGLWAHHAGHVNSVALIYALIINLRFFGFFLVCAVIGAYSPWLKERWAKLVLLPAAVVVIFGLLQRLFLPYDFLKHFGYGPKTIPAYQTVDANLDYRRIQSTLRGANPLGAYMVLVISAITAMKRSIIKIVGGLLALAVLFFSYSRSAWIGTVLALAILAWGGLARRIHGRHLALACVLAAVLAATGLYFFGGQKSVQETLLHYSSSSTAPKSSNSERAHAIRVAAGDVARQPLGRGPGTAGPASFRNNHPPRIAENYYLQVGQEVGIIGAALFIAINALVAMELWRARAGALPLVLLASLIGISFVNLLSHAWTDDTLSLLWWGLAGLVLAPATMKSRKNGRLQTKS